MSEPGIAGLCPQCLLGLALRESPAASAVDAARSETDASAPGTVATLDRLSAGRILGERYQVRELLGRGGMGEVFRAFDLKLRVDVALKAVRAEKVESERAREMLRSEVRAAREVVSPNVCRIFDLVAEDGQELVSMEFVDGETLSETLKQRGPLGLQEAREIASQFLSGLEAIHQAGLVHRDFKPENVMLTRAGRVVVMDFGLAKATTAGRTGTVSGTPAYMAPEQMRGDPVDGRADVFAAAVVLAEMLSVGGASRIGAARAGSPGAGVSGMEARQELWRAVRETPPRVPDGPWSFVLRQSLAPSPDDRHASARALARALEEVTQRLPGFETERPYPGLSSFTEDDAEYFFGRELEVEALWKKLKRPRLLALVAPSGAGKSSFLRAGLLPTLPRGWKALLATPGNRPFQALAQTLIPAFAGDTDATAALLRFEDADTAISLMQRFRQRHEHALLIVDQFEELFTLCPAEVQQAFATLLGRLVLDADLHVLVSLRDDFLFHCHEHQPLAPATSDLTILGTLGEAALRRALVQPALKCGYRFEDEALVDEMIGAVQKERGALPLLAFAAARLWETRDHERGLITRAAYQAIGGVAGALAQHAEATLERIGAQRTPIVRELFRNLVTAQGTRAVRTRDELLSLFGASRDPGTEASASRAEAEAVLDALVDARLLTSYERSGEGGETQRQVEIIHESLLSAWPRLVRWQTQDKDGAQLRDQLRQAAQLWHDRGEADDLLWSGQAYRDFALWRERYSAPLTAAEDAFAEAMTARVNRRRRRRRAAVAAIVGVAATVAIVTSVLWQRADTARRGAEAQTRRAEANKLLALGQLERETYPTAALAWAIKSLEEADTPEARLFALGILHSSPTAILASKPANDEEGLEAHRPAFSPNGEWLAVGGYRRVLLLNRGARPPRALGDYPGAGFAVLEAVFGPASDRVIGGRLGDIRAWSIPDGGELWRRQGPEGSTLLFPGDRGFFTVTVARPRLFIHVWGGDGSPPRLVGSLGNAPDFSLRGSRLAYRIGRRIFVRALDDWSLPPDVVGEVATDWGDVAISRDGRFVAASERGGGLRVWSTAERRARLIRVLRTEDTPYLKFDEQGRRLIAFGVREGAAIAHVFDLDAPPGAEPLALRRSDTPFFNGAAFDPTGLWLATGNVDATSLWALDGPRPHILRAPDRRLVQSVAFTPDGRTLVAAGARQVRAWSLNSDTDTAEPSRILLETPLVFPGLAIDPAGRQAAVAGGGGRVVVLPIAGGPPRELKGFSEKVQLGSVVFAEGGRLVAAAPFTGPRDEKVIRVWDLESGAERAVGPVPGAGEGFVGGISFLAAGPHHVVAGVAKHGLLRIDLSSSTHETLTRDLDTMLASSPDGRTVLACKFDLATMTCPPALAGPDEEGVRPLATHGNFGNAGAFGASGALVATADANGVVRVGPVTGEEPHLFLGHKGFVRAVAFSPDGRWLTSAGGDGTVRLWPVPDVTKTPLHKRPHDEFLTALRSHTNLRAVPDPQSPTGYKLQPGPFPGWANAPVW